MLVASNVASSVRLVCNSFHSTCRTRTKFNGTFESDTTNGPTGTGDDDDASHTRDSACRFRLSTFEFLSPTTTHAAWLSASQPTSRSPFTPTHDAHPRTFASAQPSSTVSVSRNTFEVEVGEDIYTQTTSTSMNSTLFNSLFDFVRLNPEQLHIAAGAMSLRRLVASPVALALSLLGLSGSGRGPEQVAAYNGVYNSSVTPSNLPWNTYNYCNAPHVNAARYERPMNVSGSELVYMNVMIRHHKVSRRLCPLWIDVY